MSVRMMVADLALRVRLRPVRLLPLVPCAAIPRANLLLKPVTTGTSSLETDARARAKWNPDGSALLRVEVACNRVALFPSAPAVQVPLEALAETPAWVTQE